MYQLALAPDGSTITQDVTLADGRGITVVRCTDEDGNSLYRPLTEFTGAREVGSPGDRPSPVNPPAHNDNPPAHNGEEDDPAIVLHPPETREPIPAPPVPKPGLSLKQVVADWTVCWGLLFAIGIVIQPFGQALYNAHHPTAASVVWITVPLLWLWAYTRYLRHRGAAISGRPRPRSSDARRRFRRARHC